MLHCHHVDNRYFCKVIVQVELFGVVRVDANGSFAQQQAQLSTCAVPPESYLNTLWVYMGEPVLEVLGTLSRFF